MKEIIGDDYPTYEDSVNMTLAERELKKDAVTDKILLSRALHRLAMIEDDIKVVIEFIEKNFDSEFKKSTGVAEEAWHHISNIEIACDLDSSESLQWKPFNSTENKNG